MRVPNIEWSWLIQHRRKYSDGPRGDMINKYNINWVPHYEEGKYDIALLHLDQQCLDPNLWDRGKGSLYRNLNEVITDIPKIVIMHGTPYYPENFTCDITEENYKEKGYTEKQIGMSSELIDKFKKEVKGNFVIFNSKRAREQWGFEDDHNSKTIYHGMDLDEWWDLPKEPRVVTMISPGGLDMYYDRTFLRAVKEELQERGIWLCHITVDVTFKTFDEYRNFLGRSLVYFNPTRESPMPRSKTEAMLSGCCVVTTPHQDADTYIKDGENGFIVKRDVQDTADKIQMLLTDYKTALKIGQEGKKTAQEMFNKERYISEWEDFIKLVLK